MGTRVYVGRLPYDVRERDLEKFFKGYGRIREILLKNGFGFVEFDDYRDADDAVYELNGKDLLGERIIVAHARGTARGRSGGGRDRDGGGRDGGGSRRRTNWIDKVSVEHARGSPHGSDLWRGGGSGRHRSPRAPPPRSSSRRSGRDKYGPPTRTEYRLIVENLSSRVSWQDLKDFMRQAGEVTYADAHKQHRNEGVVEFSSYTDMKNAIDKLSDTELNGRRIKLVEDKSHKSRRRSRSRSRSSHSHSRSRSRSSRRSRSRSRSRSPRSRSKSKTSSRSRTPHSRSVSKSKSKSKSRSRSRSVGRSKSRSVSRGKSVEKSKSRSRSPAKSVKSEDRSSPMKVSKDED